LDDLVGIVLVSDEAEGDGERTALMPLDELPEGCPPNRCISSLSFRDEGTIFLRLPSPELTVGRFVG